MTVRLLCVGDVHLGRSPGGLDRAGLAEQGLSMGELGPRAAWERAVARALEERVDALVLAGDVVDREDDFYESYGVLRDGVERLVAGGIRVLGVVGNHDVKVLPELAEHVAGFELLGRGGKWERVRIEGRGGDNLDLVAWSFPQRQVRESPLPALRSSGLLARGDGPLVGLMHGDLDATGSSYAPVLRSELAAAGCDAWVLGHVHKPGELSGARPIGYLGSLTALDANELGPRGPWLLEAGRGGLRFTHLALAPLRFEELDVDIGGAGDRGTARDRILSALRTRAAEPAATAEADRGPRVVGLRLRLVGRTRIRDELARAAQEAAGAREPGADGTNFFVERALVLAGPEIDLEAAARRADPLGLLAAQLLVLEREPGDPERSALLHEARGRFERRRKEVLGRTPEEGLDETAVAQHLRAAGDVLLDELLRQEAERGGGP